LRAAECLAHAARAAASLVAICLASPAFAVGVKASLERVLAGLRGDSRAHSVPELGRLLERHPNFHRGHLLRGDLLLARLRAIGGLCAGPETQGEAATGLRAVARAKMRAAAPPAGQLSSDLIEARSRGHTIVFVASAARLYLFDTAAHEPPLVGHYYASVGRYGVGAEKKGIAKLRWAHTRSRTGSPGRITALTFPLSTRTFGGYQCASKGDKPGRFRERIVI